MLHKIKTTTCEAVMTVTKPVLFISIISLDDNQMNLQTIGYPYMNMSFLRRLIQTLNTL